MKKPPRKPANMWDGAWCPGYSQWHELGAEALQLLPASDSNNSKKSNHYVMSHTTVRTVRLHTRRRFRVH